MIVSGSHHHGVCRIVSCDCASIRQQKAKGCAKCLHAGAHQAVRLHTALVSDEPQGRRGILMQEGTSFTALHEESVRLGGEPTMTRKAETKQPSTVASLCSDTTGAEVRVSESRYGVQ